MYIKSKENETNIVEIDAYIPRLNWGLTLLLISESLTVRFDSYWLFRYLERFS